MSYFTEKVLETALKLQTVVTHTQSVPEPVQETALTAVEQFGVHLLQCMEGLLPSKASYQMGYIMFEDIIISGLQ